MGKLMAGTAVRDITPTAEILGLVRNEGRYNYESAAHSLFLKTLVLTDGIKKFVYFCTDLSRFSVSNETAERFKRELDLNDGDYMFSTIRTHNSISGFGENIHDPKTPGSGKYAELFFDACVDSCKEAMAKAEPARIGAAEGVSRINVYREQFTPIGNFETMSTKGKSADWLRVVRVENTSGKTLALLVNYCMQNCMVCGYTLDKGGYNYITNDMAGAVVDYLERAGKHQYPVLWSNGGGADRQPSMYRLDYCEVDDDGQFKHESQVLPIEATFMIMRFLAAEQGRDVMDTVPSITAYTDEFDFHTEVLYRKVPGKKRPIDRMMHIYYDSDDVAPVLSTPVDLRLQMTIVNGISFCASNGPTYSGVYKVLKEMMPFRVTLLFDDCMGGSTATTIPTPDMEEENKYVHATLQSKTLTARIGFNAFMGGFAEMLEKYTLKTTKTYGGVEYPGRYH